MYYIKGVVLKIMGVIRFWKAWCYKLVSELWFKWTRYS